MKVVHCKRDEFDVYVGRPSVWGNPFTVADYGRGNAVAQFEAWIKNQPALIARAKRELRGKVLACWCAPRGGVEVQGTLICHAQVLARIANE